MKTTEADILKMLTQVEGRFRAFQKFDGITPSWLFSPHEAAFKKIKKATNDTVDFINAFTPQRDRSKKYKAVLHSLIDCDYVAKIEAERENDE